jgi:cystathionine beta-lyase
MLSAYLLNVRIFSMTSYQKFSQALPDTVSDATKAVHAGKDPSQHYGALNTPVYQVSTIKFPTFKALEDILLAPPDEKITYGMHGTPTTYTLEQAICALEGGYRTRLCASGLTAATAPLLCYLSAGDHLLIVDSAYGPTRAFCTSMLSGIHD